jgi:hypothetical protein
MDRDQPSPDETKRAHERYRELLPQLSGYQLVGLSGLLGGAHPTVEQLEAWFADRGLLVEARLLVEETEEGLPGFEILPLRVQDSAVQSSSA